MADPEATDEDLLRRARLGDEEAFITLYNRRQGPLFRFAVRMGAPAGVAEDVVQEVFMSLLTDTGFDPARGPLGAYLFGIARNKLRRRFRGDRGLVPLEQHEQPAGDGAGEADVLDDLARRERAERVRRAIGSLPAHYREAVVLCDLHEMTYEEAASALGCAVGTVRSRLFRGRDLLAAKLRGQIAAEPSPRLGLVG